MEELPFCFFNAVVLYFVYVLILCVGDYVCRSVVLYNPFIDNNTNATESIFLW